MYQSGSRRFVFRVLRGGLARCEEALKVLRQVDNRTDKNTNPVFISELERLLDF